MSLKNDLRDFCEKNGIDLFGVTTTEPFPRYISELETRINHYKERWGHRVETWKKYADPKQTLPEAQSVIVIGYYFLTPPPGEKGLRGKMGRIVEFGHLAILRKVRLLAAYLEKKGFKAVIGTHRKEAAIRAGLGQVGKHCLVINEKYGSWVAYQSIVTDAQLEPDEPYTKDPCEGCSICMKVCPTQALYEPHRVNPLKCVCGLLTSKEIPEEYWDKLNHYILGCDICQEKCPKNKGLKPKPYVENLLPDRVGNNPLLKDLLELDNDGFQKKVIAQITGKITGRPLLGLLMRFSWTRTLLKKLKGGSGKETLPETFTMASGKLEAYQRNAIIAAGMYGDPELKEPVEKFLDHPALGKYAKWALERINP